MFVCTLFHYLKRVSSLSLFLFLGWYLQFPFKRIKKSFFYMVCKSIQIYISHPVSLALSYSMQMQKLLSVLLLCFLGYLFISLCLCVVFCCFKYFCSRANVAMCFFAITIASCYCCCCSLVSCSSSKAAVAA